MSEPTVRVLFFAGARDIAGASEVLFPLPKGGASSPPGACTVEEFARAIEARYPALGPYMRSLRLAVNGEYALAGTLVRADDEVAVIPPVAGG